MSCLNSQIIQRKEYLVKTIEMDLGIFPPSLEMEVALHESNRVCLEDDAIFVTIKRSELQPHCFARLSCLGCSGESSVSAYAFDSRTLSRVQTCLELNKQQEDPEGKVLHPPL